MFEHLLEQIAAGLESRKILYMVIGSQAVLLYGEPRLTKDIDVTLGAGTERLDDVIRFVTECGWRTLPEQPIEFASKTMVLPCEDPASGIRLDFIFSSSVYELQAMDRVRRVPKGKTVVRFASVEDVVIHKTIVGRPRDLEDARIILLKQKKFDVGYVRYWLAEFDRCLNQNFQSRFEALWTAARGPLPSTGG